MFVRLRISPLRTKLAASHFVRQFILVQGTESHIFVNFAPQKPKIGRTGQGAGHVHWDVNITVETRRRNVTLEMHREIARRVDVGSACVDIRPSPETDVLVALIRYSLSQRRTCTEL